MILATAIQSCNTPDAGLIGRAVCLALEKAGLDRANGVLLFMTPEFSRHARDAVMAAARAAQCAPVFGGIASGVLTEEGWTLDRPAAAVMIFGGRAFLRPPEPGNPNPVLCYSGGETFPEEWVSSSAHREKKHFGCIFSGNFSETSAFASAWQSGHLAFPPHCCAQFGDAPLTLGVSFGLHLPGVPMRIESGAGYRVGKLDGRTAIDSLLQLFPERPPLHRLMALVAKNAADLDTFPDSDHQTLPLVSLDADGSIALAGEIAPGNYLRWATRDPPTAQKDMSRVVERLARQRPDPVAAMMFSCVGRGPFFYGADDIDLTILRRRFPKIPIIGCYGTGQIVPVSRAGNRQCSRNAVVAALLGAAGT
ncbi:MAG: FIST C-terminal domain-containing protein [Candidatus Accumulibacter sp.]|jgi:hypothetical protein|nr:FIST C-terminal domain-containing protein [Accumulibacter sp.]